ncbi:MAG: hypothetical protein J7M26_03775 [Armatimonadetes bacterium]|nr:hypothetical protein [Armatimonadota bacterium]
MRLTLPWLVIPVAIIVVAAVAATVLAANQGPAEPKSDVVAAVQEKPVVAAIPYKYETQYEQDPFEPDKLRRTHTTVTHVLLVRSDGTTFVKSTP